MAKLVRVTLGSKEYIVQSYRENDFVNLVGETSVRICFNTRTFSSWSKEDLVFRNIVSSMDIDNIKCLLEDIFEKKQ